MRALLQHHARRVCRHFVPNRAISYVQGQHNEKKRREYFYYLDHNGQLFLDDTKMKNFTSCFKDKEFLDFFFARLKCNTFNFGDTFPFVSPCGRELNYMRCDDTPIVFTHLRPTESTADFHLEQLADVSSAAPFSMTYAGTMSVDFEPERLKMTASGRLYYPMPPRFEHLGELALVSSPLALALSKAMRFGSTTVLHWQGEDVEVDVSLPEDE